VPRRGFDGRVAQGQRYLCELQGSCEAARLDLGGVCGGWEEDEVAGDLKVAIGDVAGEVPKEVGHTGGANIRSSRMREAIVHLLDRILNVLQAVLQLLVPRDALQDRSVGRGALKNYCERDLGTIYLK
jgi:hypothetical protein